MHPIFSLVFRISSGELASPPADTFFSEPRSESPNYAPPERSPARCPHCSSLQSLPHIPHCRCNHDEYGESPSANPSFLRREEYEQYRLGEVSWHPSDACLYRSNPF